PEHRPDRRQRDSLRRLEHRQPLRARRPQRRAHLEQGDGRRLPRTGGRAIADLPGDGTRRCPGIAVGAGEESLDDLRPGREPRADPDPDANAITNANAHAVTNVNADAHAKPNTSPNDGACSSSSGRLDWLVLTGWRV